MTEDYEMAAELAEKVEAATPYRRKQLIARLAELVFDDRGGPMEQMWDWINDDSAWQLPP